MKLLDVSHWQGNINFSQVKASGIDGVIIKAGGSDAGFYKDNMFETNYANAKAAGLSVGSYYFVGSGCVTANDGQADAVRFEKIIQGKQFDLPIYMDVETTPPSKKTGVTDAVIAFCEYLEKKGYFVGVYGSDISGFKDRMDLNRLKRFTLWVARYGSKPQYATMWNIWQYSSTGRVNGINGNVDMNECNRDFSKEIKANGKNGYPIQQQEKVDQILHKGSKVQLEGTYVVKDINVKDNTALITIDGKDYWISSTPLKEV